MNRLMVLPRSNVLLVGPSDDASFEPKRMPGALVLHAQLREPPLSRRVLLQRRSQHSKRKPARHGQHDGARRFQRDAIALRLTAERGRARAIEIDVDRPVRVAADVLAFCRRLGHGQLQCIAIA